MYAFSIKQRGATLYTVQLGLNLLWMPLFFGLGRPIEATVDIVALTGLTGYLAYIWGQVDPVAGYALLPYLAWLSFATYLSVSATREAIDRKRVKALIGFIGWLRLP